MITVAIPCYNLEDRISICIESVISQDFQDIEILVIDDHSIDNSVAVVKTLIEKHPERYIRHIVNSDNFGLCQVRNIAIQEARGEYLFFIDGDDTIEPGTLSLFHRRMGETQVDVVCGSFQKKDFDGNTYIIKQFVEDTIKGEYAYVKYIEKYINGYFNLGIWNNLYRLDFLRKNGINCPAQYSIFEDRLFTFMVVLNAQSVSYLHEITYNYYDVHNSICHQKEGRAIFLVYQAVIESVIETYNQFNDSHGFKIVPRGIRFMLNYICLSDGLLMKCMRSEASVVEKKFLLKWLRHVLRTNDIRWNNIVGAYNKVSYMILNCPFSYPMFRYYFTHLKSVKKVFVLLNLTTKNI